MPAFADNNFTKVDALVKKLAGTQYVLGCKIICTNDAVPCLFEAGHIYEHFIVFKSSASISPGKS